MDWMQRLWGAFKRVPAAQALTEPHVEFEPLFYDGELYHVNRGSAYQAEPPLRPVTIERVFDFAYRMSFAGEGAHRRTRSGGRHSRKKGEIFANAFQGKLAECAVCNFFFSLLSVKVKPDFSVAGLGKWDSTDLTVGNRQIAVKSVKHFSDLLLLEAKDWDNQGQYIPNIGKGVSSYDCIILVRMKPSCEEILKQHRILYSNTIVREELLTLLTDESWTYQLVGFITKADLVQIINDPTRRFLIKQGDKLNRPDNEMDADNYYIQAGDMRPMSQYSELFKLEG